jgi:hypothetical protein
VERPCHRRTGRLRDLRANRLNIRAGHRESDDEKVARYLNGLRYDIQDELSMATIRTVEDAYQMALKAEEKLSRKQG